MRYPRAYFLAHIAGEEIAKASMLRAASDVELGRPVGWDKLGSDLYKHGPKLEELLTLDFLAKEMTRIGDNEELILDIERIGDYLGAKNHSLYVNLAHGGFVAPSAHVTRDEAMGLIRLEKRRHEAFEQTVN